LTHKGRSAAAPLRPENATIAANFTNATNLALISIDAEGTIEFVNPAAACLFGYKMKEMIGSPIAIIIPERMRGSHSSGLARVASGHQPNLGGKSVEVFARKSDGSEFPIEITLSIWSDERGVCAGAVIKDISERRERENRLLRLASQDTLTGLHNRHRFCDLLQLEISAGRPTSVILLDLDGFKDVNDTHGHAVGDSLLQSIAVRLPYRLRADAEIARFGGDEFAVMLPGIGDPMVAKAEADAIVEAFASPFDVGGYHIDLGVSVGYALAPSHGSDADELIASADFALYGAKSAGGRRSVMYNAFMRSATLARRTLRDEMRVALHNGGLSLFYQPQVRLDTGVVFGLEALIRWRHPERGLLLPGAFLPALDQSALALEIGWWTLDEACRQAAVLRDIGHDGLKMSVNLFPAQIRAPNLCGKVIEALQKHRLDPAQLELEVTETIALHDDDKSLEVLTAIRRLGVGIAFDDFGTGYASLSSLQRYPLTTLKIDRAFIRDLLTRPHDAAITRALIAMSSDLGLETIAEGIETEAQEAALRALGCPAAQGYRYSRPMPASDLERWLAEPRRKQG
jgi:diguanylate cyclase (GGDEF)-like protein/PAS domain S-box-containing protein